jgi:hypothetical protein
MTHFLKLIETLRETNCVFDSIEGEDGRAARRAREEDWYIIEQAQPFMFRPKWDKEGKNLISSSAPDKIEDAPFPVFSIERTDFTPLSVSVYDQEEYALRCVVASEIAPGLYDLYLLISTVRDGYTLNKPHVIKTRSDRSELGRAIVVTYLEELNSAKYGVESVRKIVKIGSGANKRTHRIRSVIHIAPRKHTESFISTNRHIDWSHRFEVRGHWRKVDTVGKDREGNYNVNGYTWVTNHERGPEHLPLIKKTRVVHVDNQTQSPI